VDQSVGVTNENRNIAINTVGRRPTRNLRLLIQVIGL